MKKLAFILVALFTFASAVFAGPYDAWGRFRNVTVNTTTAGVATAQENFPLLVRLTSTSAATGSDVLTEALSTGADVRFADLAGNALSYQIERWTSTAAEVWVKVPVIAGGGATTVRMYWGNPAALSESNGAAVFDTANGFRAVWHMNEATATNLADATGLGNTAVVGGTSPTNVTTGLGIGKTFAGVANSGYSAPVNAALNANPDTGPYTVSAWVNPATCNFSTSVRPAVLGRMANNGAGQYAIMSRGDFTDATSIPAMSGNIDAWQARYNMSGTANNQISGFNTACTVGQWQYLAFTYAGASASRNNLQAYSNGSSDDMYNALGGGTYNETTPVTIGRLSDDNAANRMTGSIDEVIISKAARSSDWHKLAYETQKPSPAAVALGASSDNVDVRLSNPHYSSETVSYPLGIPITPNVLTVTGTIDSVKIAPALPLGLSLDYLTGEITGTPTVATSAANYTVTVKNDTNSVTRTLNIATVAAAPVSLVYTSESPTYTVGTVITANNPTVGGLFTGFTVAPALPAGLALNPTTGVITGTPTDTASLKNYVVTVTNTAGSFKDTLAIKVNPAVASAITYTLDTASYYQNVAITPNTPVMTVTGPSVVDSFVVVPALPAGLLLNRTTGVISGNPSVAAAAANYTVTAYNASGSRSESIRITVNGAPTVAYPAQAPTYEGGLPIPDNVPVTTGIIATWSINPALPAGLTFNTATGIISGTAPVSASGPTEYIVSVTNPAGTGKDTVAVTVTAAENYVTGWGQSATFNLNTTASGAGISAPVSQFPVLVRLTSAHASVFAGAKGNGSDIRFSLQNGTRLPYQIERWDSAGKAAEIWVEVGAVNPNAVIPVNMYWGNPAAVSKSNGPAVFRKSNEFSAVWHMNAGGTGSETDATRNAFVATATGAPTNVTSGSVGLARGMNNPTNGTSAATQYFRVTGSASSLLNYPQGGSYTVSAWVNSSNNGSNGKAIVTKSDNDFGLQLNASSFPEGVEFEHQVGWRAVAGTATLPTAGWRHMVFVHNGAAESLYVDGTLLNGSPALATSTANRTETFDVALGARFGGTAPNGSPTRGWLGSMDEVRLSSAFRSKDWVKLEYKTQKAAAAPVFNLTYSSGTYTFVEESPITPVAAPTLTGTATRFEISPALPAGLVLNTTTGAITGTPADGAAAQAYAVTAYGDSAWSVTANITVQVTALPPANLAYASNPVAYVAGSDVVTAPTYNGTITSWTIAPALPTGLAFNTTSGAITGTPLAATASASYRVIGTGPGGKDTVDLVLSVTAPPENFSTWAGNRSITMNTSATGSNVAGTVTDFPLLVRLGAGEASIFTQSLVAGGGDVRFARANGVTRLPYQIVKWDAAAKSAEIWVRVDTVYGNNATQSIKMFWGKSGVVDSSDGPAVFSSDFVNVWHMGEATGNRLSSTGGSPAVPVNYVPQSWPGMIGGADSLAGGASAVPADSATRQYLDIGDDAGYSNFTTGFTTSMWVNTPAVQANEGFLTLAAGTALTTTSASDRIIVGRNASTSGLKFRYNLGAGSNGNIGINSSGADIVHNVWQHYTFTKDPAAGPMKVYINGVLDTTVTGLADFGNVPRALNYIGRSYSPTDNYYQGKLDEVRIANRARSADWAKLEYESQNSFQSLTNIGLQAPTLAYDPDTLVVAQNAVMSALTPAITGLGVTVTVAPTLPAGLVLNASTGAVTGTPTAFSARKKYVFTATNGGGSVTDSLYLSVSSVAPAALSYLVNPASYTVGVVIDTNKASLTTGVADSFTVAPSLPLGLLLNKTSGAITGTPTVAAASAPYVVTATNGAGNTTVSLTLAVLIAKPSNIVYAPDSATYRKDSVIAAWTPTVTGTVATWTINPALPAGLLFSATTGAITGTVTATTASSQNYTVTATNTSGSATQVIKIRITVPTAILPDAFKLTVNGAERPYAFQLPAGTTTEQMTLSIIDAGGREVWSRTVHPAKDKLTELAWNGRASNGTLASAGVYVVKISVMNEGKTQEYVRKAVSLKPR